MYVVSSEFNRGYDLDGGAEVNGVFATEAAAQEEKTRLEAFYRSYEGGSMAPYSEDSDDPEWGVHVRVLEEEVQE